MISLLISKMAYGGEQINTGKSFGEPDAAVCGHVGYISPGNGRERHGYFGCAQCKRTGQWPGGARIFMGAGTVGCQSGGRADGR